MIQTSDTLGELFGALATAQARLQNAEKSGKNPHLRTTYTTLAAALDTVRPVFAECGLCVTQWPIMDDGRVHVVTHLGHKSGEWMSSTSSAPLDQQKNKVHAVGSTITYLRRYALMAVAGIAPEDDDGNAAGGRPSKREAPDEKRARQDRHHPSWEQDRGWFCGELGKLSPPVEYDALAEYLHQRGRTRPSHMTSAARKDVLEWLRKGAASKVAA